LECQLLAVDLDGTLLNREHTLSARNRAALHRAHDAGIRIVLCTGRAFTETRPILDLIGLDLDAAVSVFGALVSDVQTGRTLNRTPIDGETANAAATWFREQGYPVLWLNDADETGHDGYMLSGPNRHPAVDAWIERTTCRVQELAALPADAAPPLRLSIIDESEVLDGISVKLHAAFDGRLTHNVLHAPPYRLSLIEAFAARVNKWYGIEHLCRRWDIDPARTVAVGDDVNDIAMLRHAGLGVAVANAKPAVVDVADRITDSNDEDGVAALIDKLLQDE
jgi:Cof subfamily protein (haloacid dehalogenase superfamily)